MTRGHELAEHHPWLRRLARRFARSRARADDLVQETCVTALHNAPPDAQLRPWLRATMRKVAWGQVRSERRRAQREEGFSLTVPAMTVPDALLDYPFERERLAEALSLLPEPFRSTIAQRFLHGRSCADIARSENIPAGTVRWRQARGLELLRTGLTPPRRKRAIWALPFLGVGKLAEHAWRAIAVRGGSGKALWLWLAVTAMIYAIHRGDGAPHDPAAGDRESNARRRASAVPGSAAAAIARAGGGALQAIRVGAALHQPGSQPGVVAAVAPDAAPRLRRDPAPGWLDDAFDSRHADCMWDPAAGWRCGERSADAPPVADGLCAMVIRQILASVALAQAIPSARALVTATSEANRALARRLGCPLPPASTRELPAGGGGGVPARATCHASVRDDGIACTTCVDAQAATRSDCPEVPPVCDSEASGTGQLCTRCAGQPRECLPAQCTLVTTSCARCVDPKDRVGLDCSVDDDEFLRTNSMTSGAPDQYFAACTTGAGAPQIAGTTCHYPGLQSCAVTQDGDGHCIGCTYPDGTGPTLCGDASYPLPDPLADRPPDLPAPGTCSSELAADGSIACMTCTREDLSATKSCRGD